MAEGEVELVGLAEAQRDIERWAAQLGPAVTAAGQTLADTVASKTRDRVPVLTGTLAASVTVTDEGGGDEAGVGVSIGDDVAYAGWIEFGGSRGRPLVPEGRYLYPTARESEADFTKLAENVADDTARRFPWSTPTT